MFYYKNNITVPKTEMSKKIFNITEPNRIFGFGFVILVLVSDSVVPYRRMKQVKRTSGPKKGGGGHPPRARPPSPTPGHVIYPNYPNSTRISIKFAHLIIL